MLPSFSGFDRFDEHSIAQVPKTDFHPLVYRRGFVLKRACKGSVDRAQLTARFASN
jgi:hypothetical protein